MNTLTAAPDARAAVTRAVWVDGVFELALGLLFATAPLTGLDDAMSLPAPASAAVLVAFGIALLAVGTWLVAFSTRWRARTVRALAYANLAGAALFAAWLAASWGEFASTGQVAVALVAAGLALLGAVELMALHAAGPAAAD